MQSPQPTLYRAGPSQAKRKKPAVLRLASAEGKVPAEAREPGPEALLASGFHELLAAAPGDESLTLALAFSMAAKAMAGGSKNLCYCALASEAQERGGLYGYGLPALGIEPDRVLMITAGKEKDLLWTLEEAIASGAFGAVIGMSGPKERLYGFASSRRLKLRSAASGTPFFLMRHWQSEGTTAAQGRWRISARPSRSEGEHGGYRLLGPPRLQLRLERMGGLPPREWEMEFDATRGFHMAPLLADGPARSAVKGRRDAA